MNLRLSGPLCATFAITAWGSIYVVSKFALEHVPLFTLLFLRYAIAVAVLVLLLWGRKWARIERRDLPQLVLIGLVGYFLSVAAQFWGTELAGASVASVINAMAPVFIVVFAVPLLKERLTARKVVALAASLIGANLITGAGLQAGALNLGVAVSFCSVLSWSWMSVAVKQITERYDAISVTVYGMAVAAVCSLPVSLYEVATVPHVDLWQPSVAAAVLYMALIATAAAHVCWNKALSMLEAGTCSLFYALQPIVSVLLGALLLGERMHAGFFVGTLLIVGGVVFSVLTWPLPWKVRPRVTSP